MELTGVAVARHELRWRDVARLLDEHPTTAHRWLLFGLQLERSDAAFRAHIALLDAAIPHVGANNATRR